MYFGVIMLMIIVIVLSGASLQGVLKFRKLTKSIRERSSELPAAALLSQQVSELRSQLWQLSHSENHNDFDSIEINVSRVIVKTRLRSVEQALERYRSILENSETRNSWIAKNDEELSFVAEFQKGLDRITRILDEQHSRDWVFNRNQIFSPLENELSNLQQLATDLPVFMQARMETFSQNARTEYHAWMTISIMLGAAAVAMIGFLVIRFRDRIIRPLEALVAGSRKVAAGNYDARIELNTDDEVAELADALNAMTSNFQTIKSDLNHQVQQRTKEVVRSEKMASVGFLAAGVAHEINNPLATIAWSAESLESRLHDILQSAGIEPTEEGAPSQSVEIAEMLKYLRRIQDEAFRCKGITAGLLDFSRMGDVKKTSTAIAEVIESVIDMVKPLSKYRDKNINFRADHTIECFCNAQEMKQVALNLITNALGSIESGGTVDIELKSVGEHVELSVVDDGCGMSEETMKHLFEPFFTRRRDGQGTGLGLSITYQIIEEHGGRIFPSSDGPGLGSSFTVCLPLVKNEQSLHVKKSQPDSTARSQSPPQALKVLFADDEIHLQELIAAELPRMGHTVTVCPDGVAAVAVLEEEDFDCLIVDLDMPGMNGIQVIAKAKAISPTIEAIVLTGKGSTDTAISALRLGAFEYLQKPCKLMDLKSLLQRVASRRELTNQVHSLKLRLQRVEGQPQMIGDNRHMQRVKALIEKVAPSQSTVMILGETGTGKELAARAVHEQSLRAEKPFVAINCGALPDNLIESELFGHRKGAFTGADEHRVGLFEVANGGTLFLDEIGELPKSTQSTLLRVLESGEIRRVGDSQPFKVDVRIVCATHRDLNQMVADSDFRQDLMYRINTFEIRLPPLRDRVEDIPQLAQHLLARHRTHVNTDPNAVLRYFDGSALRLLQSHSWPGNIRELANVIEHASILSSRYPISAADLPGHLSQSPSASLPTATSGRPLREIEMQIIHATLEKMGGNKTAAAKQLGISLKTLYNKLNAEPVNRAG
jgi:two-component system NtrC family response regulator